MKCSLIKLCAIASIFLLISCNKDDDDTIEYTIPSTYNFENVSYNGQTQRLAQLTEIKTYMATSRIAGTVLDASRLLAMYENDASKADWAGTYDASKQIKEKTFELVQNDFTALFEELATASTSTVPGENGVSGVIESLDGEKSYLVGEDGLDHAQLIEKGLMGALIYYQATGVYLEPGKMEVDNEEVTVGEGTEMEHHWDEAFGYFGVPKEFPANADGLLFWGDYANKRNATLDSNQKMMDAFLKGRAAISNDDLPARDEAIRTLKAEWELISVGTALHYLNTGIEDFDDMAIRSHALSEAIGFIYALQFNPDKTITNAQIQELLETFAGSADFSEMNLYQTTLTQIQEVKDKLADYYGLADKKDEF